MNKETAIYNSREANFEIVMVRGFTNKKSLAAVPKINEAVAMLISERLLDVQGLSTGYQMHRDVEDGKIVLLQVIRQPSELVFTLQEHQDKSTSRAVRDWMVAGVEGAEGAEEGKVYIPGPAFLIFETNKARTEVYDCWAFQDVDIFEFNTKSNDREGFHAKTIADEDVKQYTLTYTVQLQHSNDEHIDQDELGLFSLKVMQAITTYEKDTGKEWDKQLSSLRPLLDGVGIPSVFK